MKAKYLVYFTTWHYDTPKRFLKTIISMTPDCLGKWKNIEYTLDKGKADYYIVIGGTREKIDQKRALYFGQHPIGVSPAFKDFKNVECLAAFPLSHYLNYSEVWINYTYNELKKLKPPIKINDSTCIVTYQTHRKTYRDRINFLQHFLPKYPQCHLYGRLSKFFKEDSILKNHYKGFLGFDNFDHFAGDHLSGKNKLLDYRYSLEFDVGKTINYVSERIIDSWLLWCFPICYGSTNIEKYFPIDSFRYVDISQESPELIQKEVNKVIDIVGSDFREQHIEDIAKARELILEKYQIWPYIHNIINNLDYYIEEWKNIKNGGLSKQ